MKHGVGKNIIEFAVGEMIVSIYSGIIYKIEKENKGMAKLRSLDTGMLEDWNSCNNSHFQKAEGQLTMSLPPIPKEEETK